jgi:peptidoglycan/xylan/chitin deacetylase (PgdA/CDA1 family)
MTAYATGVAALLILLWLVYRYSLFVPAAKGLPILMYHKVSLTWSDRLTISVDQLDRQLGYIKSQGYTPISFPELEESLAGRRTLPAKPVLITFDDGYEKTCDLVLPILRKHDCKATVFLPAAYLGGMNTWDGGDERILSREAVRELSGPLMDFGLHSYSHESYQSYSPAQAATDISRCVTALEESHCPFVPVFAYPYGRMPRDAGADRAMRDAFRGHGIHFAVRIGSRVNALPPKDPYQLKRTGVNGTDPFFEFKIKLRKGRSKLF